MTLAKFGTGMLSALIVLVLTFVTLEMSARVWFHGILGLDPRRVPVFRTVDPNSVFELVPDPIISFTYKPRLREFQSLVHFETNSTGLRDKEYPLEKPRDAFRVAVMGSSYALPAGVEIEDAFHSRLEERLSAEFAPRRYEFINFAVGTYAPDQMLGLLRARALAYDPNLIVFCLTRQSAPKMRLAWDRRHKSQFPKWRFRPGPRSFLKRAVYISSMKLRPAPIKELRPPKGAPDRGDTITKLGETSSESGIPVVVVRLEYDTWPRSPFEHDLERRIRAEGLYYLDTRTAFRGTSRYDFRVGVGDDHPNAQAHAIFADVVEEFLRSEGLLGSSPQR